MKLSTCISAHYLLCQPLLIHIYFKLTVPKSLSMPSLQKSTVSPKESASVGSTPVGAGPPVPTETHTPAEPANQPTEQKSGFFSRLFKSKDSAASKKAESG